MSKIKVERVNAGVSAHAGESGAPPFLKPTWQRMARMLRMNLGVDRTGAAPPPDASPVCCYCGCAGSLYVYGARRVCDRCAEDVAENGGL